MTNQEAIDLIHCCLHINNEKILTARDMAIQALEKQIPKKPKCKKYTDDTRCPVCNTFVLLHNKFCIECGQALDWSE